MGKKLKKLIQESIKSGTVIPYSPFYSTTDVKEMAITEPKYGISLQYNYLARFLPEFIVTYELKILKASSKYQNTLSRDLASTLSSLKRKKYILGARIKLLTKTTSENEIRTQMFEAISKSENTIIKHKFSPRVFSYSKRSKEQCDDFLAKYYTLILHSIKLYLKKKGDFKNHSDIENHLRYMDANKIFKASNYDPKLFIEYCKFNLSLKNIFVTTGLEVYRERHLISNSIFSTYNKVMDILSARPRSIGLKRTVMGLKLYREYYKEYTRSRLNKTATTKNKKENAINVLISKGIINADKKPQNLVSYNEVIKNYTAFFRFVKKSGLTPFDTQQYLDYLYNKFQIS